MKAKSYLAAGVSVLALASLATGASAHNIYYPDRMGAQPIDPDGALARVGARVAPFVAPAKSKWANGPT